PPLPLRLSPHPSHVPHFVSLLPIFLTLFSSSSSSSSSFSPLNPAGIGFPHGSPRWCSLKSNGCCFPWLLAGDPAGFLSVQESPCSQLMSCL
uniref:Uncharacterized protein n=1 Tax=Zonotrichia albicollis TaxID=44394 RepID=A0A8D2MUN3_ZONAL